MTTYIIRVSPEADGTWRFYVEEEGGTLTSSFGGHSSKSSAKNAAEAYCESLSGAEVYAFNTAT